MSQHHPVSPSLTAVAKALARAADGAATDGPLLIGLCPDGDGSRTLDVRYLGTTPHRLVGWRAPHSWGGCVLVGRGHAAPGAVALAVDQRCRPVVVVHDQARVAGPAPAADIVLRILGLPAPPPAGPVRRLAKLVWVHRVAEFVLDHPDPATITRCDLRVRAPQGLTATHDLPWRTFAQHLDDQPFRVSSRVLRWFDAGSYERAIEALVAEPADLVAAVTELVSASTAGWLMDALTDGGVTPDLWDDRPSSSGDLWDHPRCEPDPLLASFVWTSCNFGAP